MRTSLRSIVGIGVLGLALAACSGTQKTQLATSPQAPAAVGKVETRRTENKNTEVNLEVEHMAPPNKIANDATVYVVWAQPEGTAGPQNMGAFVVGKDRKGSLKSVTPHERFDLIVTPEPSGTVERPTNDPVLKAKIAPK